MDDASKQTCRFFVDDSNLWLEAKKIAAKIRLKDTGSDPRLRIDLGKLIDTISKGRRQGDSYLFGSRPPPNDSVWNAAKKRNFDVKVFDRAFDGNGDYVGKEKEVDNAMATRLTALATEMGLRARYKMEGAQEELAKTVFVVITGDRDMRPPILEVLQNDIQVELWSWKAGLSKEFLRLKNANSRLSVSHLDGIFDKITFTNFRSTRKGPKIDAARALVLAGFDKSALEDPDDLEFFICKELLELERLFFVRWSESNTELIVEFPKAATLGALETIIEKTRQLFPWKVVSAAQYQNQTKDTKWVETGNVYGTYLDDAPETPATRAEAGGRPEVDGAKEHSDTTSTADNSKTGNESAAVDDGDDDDNPNPWQMVRIDRGPQHRRNLRHAQRCSRGIHCGKAAECSYKHTDEERRLFQLHPRIDFARWKSRRCTHELPHSAQQCPYAHTEAEAWCTHCTVVGHFIGDCRMGS